ncbi:MAG: hypothetical protein V1879_02995 [Pseudomonadota bacterium]
MLVSLKREYAPLVTSGSQLILLLVGFQLESLTGWLWCLGLMALLSLFAWYSALHRLRMVSGTPTSRIGSAAQGYAELIGRGGAEETPIYAKYSRLPCLWYRYKVEYRDSKNNWHTEGTGESQAPFVIDDGTGKCIVDPQGAEIVTRHKDSWQVADYRYTEWKLIDLDHIYVLGEFRTVGGSNSMVTHKELVNRVLSEWKMDNADLMQRFDLDGNGTLDMREWMLARQAAKREAEKRLSQARAEPDTHFMLKPHDGRLFLISNFDPDRLVRRYSIWAWVHVVIFFGALAALGWLQQNPVQ